MERVYLLLRNNLESGPFTFDELLQQQLRPSDLIWVEGKSTAWAHLSEFEFLPKHVEGDAPAGEDHSRFHPDSIEQRAETIRLNTLSFTYHPKPKIEWEEREGEAAAHEAPIEIIRHTPGRSAPSMQLLGAGVVTVLMGASLYGGWSFIRNNEKPEEAVAIKLLSTETVAAKAPLSPKAALVLAADTVEALPAVDSSAVAVYKPKKDAKPVGDSIQKKEPDTTVAEEKAVVKENEPVVDKPAVVPPPTNNAAEKEKEEKDTIVKEQEAPAAEVKEKKSLGQVIKGIFKKKKKKEAEKEEVPVND